MNDHAFQAAIAEIMQKYEKALRAELDWMWGRWRIDMSKAELHEVVGAIVARQVTLAIQLARSPGTWNYHAAPLFLRAMADNYITLAWLCQDPVDRSRKMVLYGLGQAKLANEHRRKQLRADGSDPAEDPAVKASEHWINLQRYEFLLEVNVGSASGTSVRKMAEDAGCLDFFNYVYEPFSAVVHNSWHHIGKFNLTHCTNPLHRYHRVPAIPELDSDIALMLLGAKYADKMMTHFGSTFSIDRAPAGALDMLRQDIKELNNAVQKKTTVNAPERSET